MVIVYVRILIYFCYVYYNLKYDFVLVVYEESDDMLNLF